MSIVKASARFSKLLDLGSQGLAGVSRSLPKIQTIFLILSLGIALLVVSLTFLLPDLLVEATLEDSWVENAQFLSYLFAGMLQLYVFACLVRRRRMWGIFHLLLLGLFLFVAMEEISWGQRVFGWRTPAFLWEHNYQREMNIHNIWDGWYSLSNIVLILFTITYCFLLPITNHVSLRAREWLERIHFPVMGIDLVSIFFIASLFHAAPMTWLTSLLIVAIFLFPLVLFLSGKASDFFEGFERPLAQVSSIALVGTATFAVWLHEPAYQVWTQNVAFESRELLMALGFLVFSLVCVLNLRSKLMITGEKHGFQDYKDAP